MVPQANIHLVVNLLGLVETVNGDVPLPSALEEAGGCVLKNNLVTLLNIDLRGPLLGDEPRGKMRLTVLSVTFCLKVGMFSASMGDSKSSERSSTAFSKSLQYCVRMVMIRAVKYLRTFDYLRRGLSRSP